MREKNERIDNGVHEIYANLEHTSGDERIDELLSCIKKSDSNYETKTFPNVVRRVTYLKEKKEGIETMCKISEEERAAGREEGKSREQIIEKLTKRFFLEREEAERHYHKYIK